MSTGREQVTCSWDWPSGAGAEAAAAAAAAAASASSSFRLFACSDLFLLFSLLSTLKTATSLPNKNLFNISYLATKG